jgi:quercetin dioxygenase-like cupin family protein
MHTTTGLPTAASVAVAGLLLVAGTGAGFAETPPIAAEPLSERHAFGGSVSMRITQALDGLGEHVVEIDDASHLAVMRFTIQPGAVFPWHTHPGTVLISITEGDFVFVFAEDCVPREFSAGGALVDPGDTVHTSYNPSTEAETVVVATFIGVPAEGGLTLPVDDGESLALDEQCGIDRDDIASAHAAH